MAGSSRPSTKEDKGTIRNNAVMSSDAGEEPAEVLSAKKVGKQRLIDRPAQSMVTFDLSMAARDHADSTDAEHPPASRARVVEAERQKRRADALARLTAPTTAWKAKQKDPVHNRVQERPSTSMGRSSTGDHFLDLLVAPLHQEPEPETFGSVRPRRSMSTGSIPSITALQQANRHHDSSSGAGESLQVLREAMRSQPPRHVSQAEWACYVSRSLLDDAIPETPPLHVTRKRITTGSSAAPPVPRMNPARKIRPSSTFGTMVRPDPFAPKEGPSFRANDRSPSRPDGMASRRNTMYEPGPSCARAQTRVAAKNDYQCAKPSRLSRGAETPGAFTRERVGDDDDTLEDSLKLGPRIKHVGEDFDRSMEGHIKDKATWYRPGMQAEPNAAHAVTHETTRQDSGTVVDFKSSEGASSHNSAAILSAESSATQNSDAGPALGLSNAVRMAFPDSIGTEGITAGVDVQNEARKQAEDLAAKERARFGKVVPKGAKSSSLKATFKGAIEAFKTGFVSTGKKSSTGERRNSLDSLKERPTAIAVPDSRNELLRSGGVRSKALSGKRSAQPLVQSALEPTAEETEEAVAAATPEPEPQELAATDADGNVRRRSAETIRVWNEGGAQWLKTKPLQEK